MNPDFDEALTEIATPMPLKNLEGVFDIWPVPAPPLSLEPRLGASRRLWGILTKQRLVSPWVFSGIGMVFIAFVLGGLWWLSPKNPVAVELPTRPDEQIGLRFYGVELRGRKQGTPFFTIFADEVEVSRDQRYIEFKQGSKAPKTKPHGEFFNLKVTQARCGQDGNINSRRLPGHAGLGTRHSLVVVGDEEL